MFVDPLARLVDFDEMGQRRSYLYKVLDNRVQLFNTNAFSANKFSLNVLTSFTAIYSQSIVNTNNFVSYFYQRRQISRKGHRIY